MNILRKSIYLITTVLLLSCKSSFESADNSINKFIVENNPIEDQDKRAVAVRLTRELFDIYFNFVPDVKRKEVKLIYLPKIIEPLDSLDFLTLEEVLFYTKDYYNQYEKKELDKEIKRYYQYLNSQIELYKSIDNVEDSWGNHFKQQLKSGIQNIDDYHIVFVNTTFRDYLVNYLIETDGKSIEEANEYAESQSVVFEGNKTLNVTTGAFVAETIIKDINNSIYGVSDNLIDLVFSENYVNSQDNILPNDIMKLLENSFDELKFNLNEQNQKLTKNVKLNFSKQGTESPLWLEASLDEVYVSPNLIRAVFMLTVDRASGFFNKMYREYYQNDASNKLNALYYDNSFSTEDLLAMNELFWDTFKNSIDFIFSHELAHIYLSDGVNLEFDEYLCDCYGAKSIAYSDGSFNTGVFESLVVKSIEYNRINIWGKNINSFELKDRLKKLNGLYATDFDCN